MLTRNLHLFHCKQDVTTVELEKDCSNRRAVIVCLAYLCGDIVYVLLDIRKLMDWCKLTNRELILERDANTEV